MQPLKDIYYSADFYRGLSSKLQAVYPAFNAQSFCEEAATQLPELELKERITLTSTLCRKYLPDNYKKALRIFYDLSKTIPENFAYIFMPDFVARYGAGHFDLSMQALKDFTHHSSSELALRTFLKKDLQRTLTTVYQWAADDDFHVRRLASEGTRPRLPWAPRIAQLQEDPDVTLPIINALKSDPEKYVQKSVANHLNDISKDHPEKMLAEIESWDHKDDTTAWIIKHATRSLVKQGHPQALALLGAAREPIVDLKTFLLDKEQLRLGESLPFRFTLESLATKPQNLIVDYKIHYVKKSGELKAKVFKLKQMRLNPGESVDLNKRHLFKDFTTRKHYSGEHAVEIVINGKPLGKANFHLQVK